MKKLSKIPFAFICIIFLSSFLRLYKIDTIPNGLYQDETAIGYNAFSLLQTGKDEHGKKFPLYFESFGDYKLPVYIYLTALSEQIFGVNEFAVRLPSALFGILSIFFYYYFSKAITKSTPISLLATLFLAVNPWHIHYSRATFEVSIVLFLFIAGMLSIIKGFEKTKTRLLLIGSLFFILSMYTYNLARLLAPVLLLSTVFIYKNKGERFSKKIFVLGGAFLLLLLFPFIYTLFSSGGINSASGTLIFSSASVQANLLEFRSYLAEFPIVNRTIFSYIPITLWQYLKNIFLYFSAQFFFVSGSQHGNHGIGTNGQFYLFELPLMILTTFVLMQKNKNLYIKIILPAVVTVLVAALTREAPHATRSFSILLTAPMLSAFGVSLLFQEVKKLKVKTLLFTILFLFVFYSTIEFFTSYFLRFPTAYAKQWRSKDKELSYFILEQEKNYEKIIFDTHTSFIYTSYLFYTKYSPWQFHETQKRTGADSEGFKNIVSFGKYEFKDVEWEDGIKNVNALIITTPDQKPADIQPLKTFYYPKRPVVLALKQTIVSYPVEEIAYVAVESKKH